MDKYLIHGIRLSVMIAALSLAGCATTLIKEGASPLPLETVDKTQGHIESTRAFETKDTLYVVGTLHRPIGRHLPKTAHVDVELIGANGRILAEKQDDISPQHPRLSGARGGKYSYVVSFPIATARQAAKIRVSYHLVDNH
jgi:hypothetical protein